FDGHPRRMRVFVAGATGVLGRRIVRQLVARGNVAVGLTRSESGDATVRSIGGEPRRADLFDVDALAKAAEGCSVVIHAATAIPTKVRTRPKDWDMNDRIRREGTRALTAAAGRVGAGAWLHAEDAASAFVAASEWPKSGLWHVVDDRPASLREFLGLLAEKLGTRPPRRVSRSVARLFVGRYAADLLAASFPTSNERFRSDFRWTASFPTFEKGLGEVVAAWRSEGFPGRQVPRA